MDEIMPQFLYNFLNQTQKCPKFVCVEYNSNVEGNFPLKLEKKELNHKKIE